MSTKDIHELLAELYAIDPALRQHEGTLMKVIEKLLAAKPDVEINAAFKQELRAAVLKKAGELTPLPKEDARGFFLARLFTARNFAMAAAGAVIVIAIMVLVSNKPGTVTTNPSPTNGLQIQQLSQNAFGSLSEANMTPTGFGGGTGVGGGAKSTSAPTTVLPSPDAVNYRYVYKGNTDIYGQSEQVLKKVPGKSITDLNTGLLNAFGMGLADISAFDGLGIQNVTLAQNKDFGYSVDINTVNGTLSVQEVWDRWYGTTPADTTRQLTAADVPADQVLIGMADAFLKKYQVNMDTYGQPTVDSQMEKSRSATPDAAVYISDIVQVTYPLQINGKYVYLPSGQRTGLSVSINIRLNKVTGFTNLTTQKYQSAAYDTIQDKNVLNTYIEKGGIYGYSVPNAKKTTDIALGDPTLVYVSLSQIGSATSTDQYLVPALAFPNLTQKNAANSIIVPLIKEFFPT